MNRCAIIIPIRPDALTKRSVDARVEEAIGLAAAIELDVTLTETQVLKSVKPSTLFGTGKVEEFGEMIAGKDIDLVIVDDALSPVQQRNLETAWKCKVIDRTALILEIFGERARTKEGKLQVELAALNYQKGRLVRSWTHLERQRGGAGFMGGPGEKQIESDRRILREKITKLKAQLDQVTKTRRLQRQSRKQVPYPIIALVGYTNAGKSTLFNTLTDANVFAEDLLFATLDPTMRAITLPSGITAILSDTVGFVSNLPTELVAAFRATLEEVIEADLILHIRDIASDETDAQKADVISILQQLLPDEVMQKRVVEVWNKVDLLDNENAHSPLEGESKSALRDSAGGSDNDSPPTKSSDEDLTPPQGGSNTHQPRKTPHISALTGQGVPQLMQLADDKIQQLWEYQIQFIELPVTEGKKLAWLHQHATVLEQTPIDDKLRLKVNIQKADLERFGRL